jgi:hypothetical protein
MFAMGSKLYGKLQSVAREGATLSSFPGTHCGLEKFTIFVLRFDLIAIQRNDSTIPPGQLFQTVDALYLFGRRVNTYKCKRSNVTAGAK